MTGMPLIAAAPTGTGRSRKTISRLLGHSFIRLGRALSRRGLRGTPALAHGTLAR
jgi:hypothetical protein